MKTKLFNILAITAIAISSLFAMPALAEEKSSGATTGSGAATGTKSATSTNICGNNEYPEAVRQSAGCNNNANALPGIIQVILNTIISVCGIVAAIYVVIGGYGYMTSSGDSSKVEKAKKTITYAVIGIIICAFAFIIVNWVISTVANVKTGAEAYLPSKYLAFFK
ncbi:hypothetical protein IKD98_03865 [Candidatus Saccharibacteria bacterium]|nr:hypothetical protein [Candidatus Saccharibacteria bacterium]